METKEEDFVSELFIGATHDTCFLFKSRTAVLAEDLPDTGSRPAAKGKALVNLLALSEEERITTAFPVRISEGFLVKFTKNGTVRKQH